MKQFDYLFALRPSVACNFNCGYCYRSDFLELKNRQIKFDIDSMLWHAEQMPNNLFNFCGYGETMMHPQFGDMIVEISKITTVNWITNGTMFGGSAFSDILQYANHGNIMDVVISVHADQIKRAFKYSIDIRNARHRLSVRGIRSYVTAIVTNDNVDAVISLRKYFPDLIIKHPFEIYVHEGKTINYTYSPDTRRKLDFHKIIPDKDWTYGDMFDIPYTGKPCPNGTRIFEVMHDGIIYDCSYDENRIIIGDINKKEKINALPVNRKCKSQCTTCIPFLRNSYGLLKPLVE